MSSWLKVSKVLLKKRLRIVNLVLGIQALAIVALEIFKYLGLGANDTRSFTGNIFIGLLIIIVFLTIMNERIIVNNNFRLIPITDNALYGTIMITALLSLIYSIVGEIVIYLVAYKLFPNEYDQIMMNSFNSVQQYLFKFEIFLAFILGIVVVWTGVMVLHLLIDWVNNFLPFKNQALSKSILTIVSVWIFMIPFNFITGNVLRIMGFNNLGNNFNSLMHVMYASLGMMFVWIIIFSIINLYLLNKKSETNV